ncbi:hypothetical protein JQC67_12785 [Aurantibacter crassamenti]|uniref:hypothetical protein n=1 Tax=Aurantibacter crassamenti TaxID=1837375 RepID=UPI00193A4316|nr:hypothetical protein [Aurantibacter crassamenti]MBM1107020.1 hypothetical protein [Aurantibacter crassamenti]
MKNIVFIFLLMYLFTGCENKKITHQETVTSYYKAFDSGDYNKIKALIDDSLTVVGGDFIMPFTPDSFYEQFKWDSIFKPSYEILELEEKNNQIIATVASRSLRYAFLKNNPLTCRFAISFTSGKISKIEDFEYIDANWNVWQKERDSLVQWTKINHPELDGFINDLSMKGALNYMQAIELYEKNKHAEN